MKQKVSTNYGEDYNRESMYETAREILLTGKKVKINGKEYKSLIEVMIEDARLEEEKYDQLKAKADEFDKIKGKEFETLKNLHYAINYLEKAISIRERANKALINLTSRKKDIDSLLSWIEKTMEVIDKDVLPLEDLTRCYEVISQVEQFYDNEMFGDGIFTQMNELYNCAKRIRLHIEDKITLAKSK